MKLQITRRGEFETSRWSGGTTTQLAIFPADAEYAARNFTWRVSSARVEVQESVFTSLPGVRRTLMVLEGSLALTHEGHHSCVLAPFEQDSFMGDWTTLGRGQVVDFNVMTRGGCESSLDVLDCRSGSSAEVADPCAEKNSRSSAEVADPNGDFEAGKPVEVVLEHREGFSQASLVVYFLSAAKISTAGSAENYAVKAGNVRGATSKDGDVSGATLKAGDVLTATLDADDAPLRLTLNDLTSDFRAIAVRIWHK